MNDDNNNQGQAPEAPVVEAPVQSGSNPEYDNVFAADQLPTVDEAEGAQPAEAPADAAPAEEAPAEDDWKQDYNENQLLEALVANMINEKGVEDKYGTILAEVKDKLVLAINNAVIDALPADFDMDAVKDQDDLNEKLAAAGVDVNQIMKDTIGAFRDDYLSGKEL